jgi:hypothetical protein
MANLHESWTLGGKVLPKSNFVTNEALAAANELIARVAAGDRRAILEVQEHLGFSETVTTGDSFVFNFGQLVGLEVADQLVNQEEEDALALIDTEVYSDFDAIQEYTLTPLEVDGLSRVEEPGRPGYALPVVAEWAPYPEFGLSGSESVGGSEIVKRGARFAVTLEAIAKDAGNIVPRLPGLISQQFADTIQWDAWSHIIAANTATNRVAGGSLVDGSTVAPNPSLSRNGVSRAIYELKNRTEGTGRYERKLDVSTFVLLVPKGQKETAQFALYGTTFIDRTVTDGSIADRFTIDSSLFDLTGAVSQIVETDLLTGTEWGLIPTKGSTRKKFAVYAKKAGFEVPEIRVTGASFAGNILSGSNPNLGVFGATSFDTDTAQIRGRLFGTGALFHPEYSIWSTGTNAA